MATRQAADPPPPPLANQALALPGGPHPPMGTQGQLKAFLLHAMDWVSLFLDFFLISFCFTCNLHSHRSRISIWHTGAGNPVWWHEKVYVAGRGLASTGWGTVNPLPTTSPAWPAQPSFPSIALAAVSSACLESPIDKKLKSPPNPPQKNLKFQKYHYSVEPIGCGKWKMFYIKKKKNHNYILILRII